MNESNAESTQRMPARIVGLVLIGAGLVMGFIGIYLPIADVQQQADEINYYSVAFFLTPVALGLGLIYAALGPVAEQKLGHPLSPNGPGIIIGVVLAAVGLGLKIWFDGYMQAAGYG